jgi:hypothetical protein
VETTSARSATPKPPPCTQRVKCEGCGKIVVKAGLRKHQESRTCRAKTEHERMRARGWVAARYYVDIPTLDELKLPFERHETKYKPPVYGRGGRSRNEIWIPRWAMEITQLANLKWRGRNWDVLVNADENGVGPNYVRDLVSRALNDPKLQVQLGLNARDVVHREHAAVLDRAMATLDHHNIADGPMACLADITSQFALLGMLSDGALTFLRELIAYGETTR